MNILKLKDPNHRMIVFKLENPVWIDHVEPKKAKVKTRAQVKKAGMKKPSK